MSELSSTRVLGHRSASKVLRGFISPKDCRKKRCVKIYINEEICVQLLILP